MVCSILAGCWDCPISAECDLQPNTATSPEGIIMKTKINFAPQELSAVFVEAISGACLTSLGLPPGTSSLVSAALAGAAKGISLSRNSCTDAILSSVEKAIQIVLEDSQIEFPDRCREMLQQDILSPKKLIHFLYQPDSLACLEEQILQICSRDPSCDIRTFPVDELLSKMIARLEAEVLDNHELASYAAFCILSRDRHTSPIYTANQQYVNSFTEPLFLHKHEPETKATLSNLFVLQKYRLLRDTPSSPAFRIPDGLDLQGTISAFLKDSSRQFMIIEGDAGSGKTSLVAWMNYHFSIQDNVSQQLFDNRPLLTIRLRDLDKKDIAKDSSLSGAILNYMKIPTLDKLEKLFPNAVMVLDGFDELCMIEGMDAAHDHLLYDLQSKMLDGFHFIVTTRPKFVRSNIDINAVLLSLEHFDALQREEWLERYTSKEYCDQTLDSSVSAYIRNIDWEGSSCICDTPQTLYMLAAKKGSEKYLHNAWSLYHHIFEEVLSETEYNKMFPDPNRNYAHDINKLRSVLYQVSEEIAYHMYKKQNQHFYLSDHELSEIISGLSLSNPNLKRANMQDIAERCYALCCYWKANSDRGVVEFLHNNIRDFFLAEKIYRMMNDIVKDVSTRFTEEDQSREIAKKLCRIFPYGILETKVTEFIYLRAKYHAETNQSDFSSYEYETRLISRILKYMAYGGIIESNVLSDCPAQNPIQTITNIATCTAQVYRYAFEPHLKKSERINWSPDSSNDSLLIMLFKQVFSQVPVTLSYDRMLTMASRGDFSFMDFRFRDLRNIGFQHSSLFATNFSDTVLSGCDFSHADLRNANLTNADIHYACLQDAVLNHCTLTGADLRGTELPDGFAALTRMNRSHI